MGFEIEDIWANEQLPVPVVTMFKVWNIIKEKSNLTRNKFSLTSEEENMVVAKEASG